MVGIAAIVLVVVGGGVYVAATAANLHTNSSVLDLRSDRELSLPATIGIDDQAAWLDDGRPGIRQVFTSWAENSHLRGSRRWFGSALAHDRRRVFAGAAALTKLPYRKLFPCNES